MADTETTAQEKKRGGGKLWLLIGLVFLVAGGFGGFFAARSGLLPTPWTGSESDVAEASDAEKDEALVSDLLEPDGDIDGIEFVPVEPLIVSLGDGSAHRLRFRANLEVEKAARAEVEQMMPRVIDVMNAYLRAADPKELESRGALVNLRAQLLRRVDLVLGPDRVRDILVMEYVFT